LAGRVGLTAEDDEGVSTRWRERRRLRHETLPDAAAAQRHPGTKGACVSTAGAAQ